jgi:hypothetical protein
MGNQFLTEKRGVPSDWYFDQAAVLLEFALRCGSATALVYAALEARNALERFVLEMSLPPRVPMITASSLTAPALDAAEPCGGSDALCKSFPSHSHGI